MAGNLHLSITGDAGSALAELAKVKAAIDGLSGKTVRVRVDVDGSGKALGDLQALTAATDDLTRSTRQYSRAARVAAKNTADHGAAAELAGEAVRNYGGDIDRAGGTVRRTGGDVDRANDSLGDLNRSTTRVGGSVSRLGGAVRDAGGGLVDAVGDALTLGRGLGAVGKGALYATAGSGLLTAGVGALGVGSAAALVGVGAGLGAAAAGVTAFTVDSLKNVQGFKQSFESIGRAVQGYSAWITEPYGAALVQMADQASASAPALAAPLRESFAEIGATAQRGLPGMLGAAAYAVKGFQDLTTASTPAFDAFFRNLPALAEASIDPLKAVANTFGQVADRAFTAGVPAYRSLTAAVGDFGSEIVRIGADNFAPTLNGMASMTREATDMAHELRPAIRPSMDAFTDFSNSIMRAVGNSAPAIADFARTVSANSYGLQQGAEGFIQGGLAIGGAIVDIGGKMGPAIKSLGSRTESFFAWADSFGSGVNSVIDTITGARRDPATGYVDSMFMDMLVGAGGGPGGFGDTSAAGRRAGGAPGEFSGFTASWRRGAGGAQLDLPAGAAEQIQQIQNRIDAGGLTQGQTKALEQAQRYAARGVDPSFAFKGRPGGAAEYAGLVGSADASVPGGAPAAARAAARPPAPAGTGRSGGGFLSGLMDAVFGPGIANAVRGAGGGGGIGSLLGNLTSGATTAAIVPGLGGGGIGAGQAAPAAAAQNVRAVGAAAAQATPPMQTFRSAMAGAFTGAAAATPAVGAVRAAMAGVSQAFQAAPAAVRPAVAALAGALPQIAAAVPQAAAAQVAQSPAPVQAAQRMVSRVQNIAPQASAAGSDIGAAISSGAGAGVTKTETKTMTIMRRWATKIVDVGKSVLGIASPSRVFIGIGENVGQGMALGVENSSGLAVSATSRMAQDTAIAGGLGSAVGSASDGVRGIASDRGLQIGYSWARSVITGADTVLKTADFQTAVFPQIESPQAKAALGALGLLGPAGSGAQIWKTKMVTLGGGGPAVAAAPKTEVHVYLDGQPFRQMTAEAVDTAFDELAASISRQVG